MAEALHTQYSAPLVSAVLAVLCLSNGVAHTASGYIVVHWVHHHYALARRCESALLQGERTACRAWFAPTVGAVAVPQSR